MKTRSWILIGAGVLLILLLGWTIFGRGQVKGGSGSKESRMVPARTGNIIETVDATGEVVPLNRVEIKPTVSGRIEKILVEEGEVVRAGAILAWMSSTERASILDAARAIGPDQLKQWEDSYRPAPVLAPISGTIILKNVVPGQTVDTSTVLFALSDRLIVLTQVDEVDISRVLLGMKALITLDAYPNRRIQGKVLSILYEGRNTSNVITYDVKVVPEEVTPFFRSQMTANVSLVVNEKQNVLLVPVLALQARPNGDKYVLLSVPRGRPQPQTVVTGVDNGTEVEVVSGLKEGDQVMIQRARYQPQGSTTTNSPLMPGPRGGSSTRGGGH